MELPRCKICGNEPDELNGFIVCADEECELSGFGFTEKVWLTLMSPDPMTERMVTKLQDALECCYDQSSPLGKSIQAILTEYNSKEGK